MTIFLRLLADREKASNLLTGSNVLRAGETDPRLFDVAPESFRHVPGAPFAYWVSEAVRKVFERLPPFECDERTARQGLATAEDFRFVRAWWEKPGNGWRDFAKGGTFSPFYADVYLVVNWKNEGQALAAFSGSVIRNPIHYSRPGLTWPRRTTSGLSVRAMPEDCIFGDKGPAAFVAGDAPNDLLALCGMTNSQAFGLLVSLQLAAADAAARSYEVGVIQKTPIPDLSTEHQARLAGLARRAWSLKRSLDTIEETSHAFVLPAALRARQGDFDPPAIERELEQIQTEIDAIAFGLYGFSDADQAALQASQGVANEGNIETSTDDEGDAGNGAAHIDHIASLLSWAVGVVFGRFDWRLATGQRVVPAEPEPFDPLPTKSPGMLPDGAEAFHAHAGILLDDRGHPHDLARLVEEVFVSVESPVPSDVRRWLQQDFFAFHLQRYSKSRRKAPIYWPLSTTSGSYTLWIYYPSLTGQTLYTAINEFVDPELKRVGDDVATLRSKGSARTRADEKQFEAVRSFEQELIELRDSLLRIAPTYKPKHDDGVQVSAAPLWPLFRHKPWQKLLKETWAMLEKGDYDWAHLAMNYWPDRVREKCKTDKSLAIAHGLESLYIASEAAPKQTRGRKRGAEE